MKPAELLDAFETLADAPGGVEQLRRLVLALAVRGRLEAQDPRDEPASQLLERVGAEVAVVEHRDEPFELPESWEWSTLPQLGAVVGGATPGKKVPEFWDGTIPWVTPKDMKRSVIDDSIDHVTPKAIAGTSVKLIDPPAVLLVVRGMILAHSFPVALTTTEVTVNQDMKALIPAVADLGPFLLLALRGLKCEVLERVERSTHGTCKLPTNSLFALPIPIPPLAEQRRIVAKVDDLMALCDELESRLERARAAQEAFAASAVASVA